MFAVARNTLSIRDHLCPFPFISKPSYLLVGSPWERMLINASKMEEEDGLRKKMGGRERGAFAGKGC